MFWLTACFNPGRCCEDGPVNNEEDFDSDRSFLDEPGQDFLARDERIPQDLYLTSPWMNAAGTMGFAPPARWPLPESMGAFVTNPISLSARLPASDRDAVPFPGGFLLHTGYPNPGINRILKRYATRWAQSSLPVWVHLLANNPSEVHLMVRRLEGVEGVMALEMGLPPRITAQEIHEFIQAAYGELPLVISLPLTAAGEPWIASLARWGVSAVTLSAPRGLIMNENGKLVSGRLFGPAFLPITLAAVHTIRRLGLRVIAGPGIFRPQDARVIQDAGAFAIQLDGALWRGWSQESAIQ